MALDKSSNFAKTTITGIASGVTSVTLADATNFLDPASGEYNCVIWEISSYGNPADDPNKEIVRATALNGSTLTITRAQEGTVDGNHNTGGETYAIANVLTAKMITDISSSLDEKAIAPATNTADYIPQWNGANSKTLKDGLPVPAGGLAGLTSPIFATSITGSYLTASEILITDADKKIVSAPVATYPSLTELSYVKGVTSAIQTQLGARLPLTGGTMTGNITLGENASIALDPAGSADGKYTGITVTGTAGATVAFGDLITLDKDDSRWELVDISVAAAATGDARGIMGMAVSAGNDGDTITILLHGIIRADANFPALTIGAAVYASTSGDIVVTQPSTTDYVIRLVGYALTADEIYFNPENDWITHT